ncbi:MAG: phosphodiesterase [Pseudomonadales bacterium]|nr:phosphodiesterase [Pseudomonadales bacterium]
MKILAFIFSTTLILAPLASAEVLEISISKQAPELQNIDLPPNGMDKEDVESKYGPPEEISDPVGEPPISKWRYRDFVVYFESDTVIHTVLNYQPKDTP